MKLSSGEQKAYDAIIGALNSVVEIDGKRLQHNTQEVGEAIHTLQAFVKQHVLHRLDSNLWSNWYGD